MESDDESIQARAVSGLVGLAVSAVWRYPWRRRVSVHVTRRRLFAVHGKLDAMASVVLQQQQHCSAFASSSYFCTITRLAACRLLA